MPWVQLGRPYVPRIGLFGLLGTLVLLPSMFAAPAPSRAAPAEKVVPKTDLDPKALAALTRSENYLRTLSAFNVRAQVTQDEIVYDDFKLQRTAQVNVAVRRPDRMRAELSGDQGQRLFNYDGKVLSVFVKDQNYYSSTPAPATLRETLDAAIEKHDLQLPLVDVIYVAMGGDLKRNLLAAGEIGPSMIDGTPCTQLAFRDEKVDWQLWIEQGEKPVPRRIVITTTDDPTRPQYSATMRWDMSEPPSDASFKFSPPEGALPIKLGAAPLPAGQDKPSKAGTQSPKASGTP